LSAKETTSTSSHPAVASSSSGLPNPMTAASTAVPSTSGLESPNSSLPEAMDPDDTAPKPAGIKHLLFFKVTLYLLYV